MSQAVLFPNEKVVRRRKVILTVCLILAVVGSLSAVAWRWANGVDTQNQAVRVMFAVVNDFLNKNDGRWPENWEELETMPSGGNWYDPVNFKVVKEAVLIDFDVNTSELAQQSPADFQAIRPVNPVFDFAKDPRLVALLTTIKKYENSPQAESPGD